MSSNNSEAQPSMGLPAPAIEQAPGVGIPTEKAPKGAEKAPVPEQAAQTAPQAAPSLTTIPLPIPPNLPAVTQQQQPAAASAIQGNPLAASDDGDLIEKEWVNKAKQIVELNRDDPYKQSEELTVFKADYMKKRYNKTIKLNN